MLSLFGGVSIGFLISYLFSEMASDDLKPLGFVFLLFGCFFPIFFIFVYQTILNNKYKKKPELFVKTDWIIKGTLCPKCRTGKINYSILYDGKAKLCGGFVNQIFVCLNCNTVYPENYLTIYFGINSPWMRGRRQNNNH
jgi:hypothetical protein